MSTKVVALMLKSGVTIIGREVSRDTKYGRLVTEGGAPKVVEERIILYKIRSINAIPVGPGRLTMMLLPFLAMNVDPDIEVPFHSDDFLLELPQLNPQMEEQYIQETSGIALAGNGAQFRG